MSDKSFIIREEDCQVAFHYGGPYYMLSSPGLDHLMFIADEDFKVCNNLIAIALNKCGVSLLHYVIMNNHLHLLLEGAFPEIQKYADGLKRMLRRFESERGYPLSDDWGFHFLQANDLMALRRFFAYISRNPYVASRDATPTGYPWSGGVVLFNGIRRFLEPGKPFEDLSVRDKRKICRSHEIMLPSQYRIADGRILPESFLSFQRAEQFFNSANQFFSYLYRQGEADVEIAHLVGESILLPNDEVFSIVCGWFRVKAVKQLTMEQRLEAAKRMRFELASNPKQISQILRIPLPEVEKMFPRPQ